MMKIINENKIKKMKGELERTGTVEGKKEKSEKNIIMRRERERVITVIMMADK